jgi:hypothetical protein
VASSLVPASGDATHLTYTSFGQVQTCILGPGRRQPKVGCRFARTSGRPRHDVSCKALPAPRSIADPLDADVGNIIFDDGVVCGWKKWSPTAVQALRLLHRADSAAGLFTSRPPLPDTGALSRPFARHIISQSGNITFSKDWP